MKKYQNYIFRYNHQLSKGGYQTTRIIEARTIISARKKAQAFCECAYGSKSVTNIEEL